MKFVTLITALFCLLVFLAHGASFAADGHSLSSVNGSVEAAPGSSYDALSTVNGDVTLGRGASAATAKTVNGDIHLEDNSKVGNTSTVNGSLHLAEGVVVEREASSVNGDVELAKRARVGGDVSTVSGSIELRGAEVAGKLQTTNGDIDLLDGARVHGGILVRGKNRSWGWGEVHPVHVNICASCVVEGTLRFERPVVLHVENGGKIGPVEGDEVTRR